MRVLVCGGRDFNNEEKVFNTLNSYDADHDFTVIIEGGAKGADRAARKWAEIGGLKHITFEANWKKYGRAAGPIRNELMIKQGKPDLVIAFPGGRGTENMVCQAKEEGITVYRVQ